MAKQHVVSPSRRGGRRAWRGRLAAALLGAALAGSCRSDGPAGAVDPRALPRCDGRERIALLPGDSPAITWRPACRAHWLEFHDVGGGEGALWWNAFGDDNLAPPMAYGVTPPGATVSWPPAPLARGRTYEVSLAVPTSGGLEILPPDTVSLPLPVRSPGAPPQPGPHVLVEAAGGSLPTPGCCEVVHAETLYFAPASRTYRASGTYRIKNTQMDFSGPRSTVHPYTLVGTDSVLLPVAALQRDVYGRYVGDTLVVFRDRHYCRDASSRPGPCPPIARYVRR